MARVLADLALDALGQTRSDDLLMSTVRAAAEATDADLALLLQPTEDSTFLVRASHPAAGPAAGTTLPEALVGVRWPAPGDALPIAAPPAGVLRGSFGKGTVGALQVGSGPLLLLAVWRHGHDLAATAPLTELLKVASAALARLDAHEALRSSEQRLADAQAIGHMGSYDWDIATDRNAWSDELFRIYGFEPGAFNASYERFLALVHPDDRETVIATHQQAYAEGSAYSMRERIVRPDGEVRTLLTSGEVVLGPDGKPARMRGICWDVTDRADIPLSAPTPLGSVVVPAARDGAAPDAVATPAVGQG